MIESSGVARSVTPAVFLAQKFAIAAPLPLPPSFAATLHVVGRLPRVTSSAEWLKVVLVEGFPSVFDREDVVDFGRSVVTETPRVSVAVGMILEELSAEVLPLGRVVDGSG